MASATWAATSATRHLLALAHVGGEALLGLGELEEHEQVAVLADHSIDARMPASMRSTGSARSAMALR